MSRRIAIAFALLILSAALLPWSVPAQEDKSDITFPDIEALDEPIIVFKSFEKAWREGNAHALSNLGSDSPILVEVRGIERRGGYFTKAQLLYIMKEMFGNTNQISFRFVKFHNIEKQDRRIYGIAQRSYRVKQNGGLYRDKVYVTLVREESRWAVAEIKSTW